jgi:hypothetical protein
MLASSHLRLELYLHQLLPAVLSCALNKRLCRRVGEDHWRLRRCAAGIVRDVCAAYGADYPRLQPRVTRTLHDAFADPDPKRPLATRYGAVVALEALGPLAVEQLVLPHFGALAELCTVKRAGSARGRVRAHEARRCLEAATSAVGRYLRRRLAGGVATALRGRVGAPGVRTPAAGPTAAAGERASSAPPRAGRAYRAWRSAAAGGQGAWEERKWGKGAEAGARVRPGKSSGAGGAEPAARRGGRPGEDGPRRRAAESALALASRAREAAADAGLPARLCTLLPEDGVRSAEVFFPYSLAGATGVAGLLL